MAQNIILKRSAVPGRVPDTGSINLGEVAINTFDGKLYFKKSGSVESVETIVTTNSITSGSIFVSDDITIQQDLYVVRDVITDGDIDASGSLSGSGLSINDTLSITHNNFQLSGSAAVTGSLTVLGEINARQFNINIISSSIIFESGSSKFGNTSDDTHSFTGSVQVTGSLYLNGVDLSQGNNSGSFSGSFQGDGSGLRGVVSDDIPRDGWDYDSNSSASISEFNVTSSKYLIDFQWEQELGSPVGYKGFIANTTGSTQIVPTTEGIKFIVGNELVATIGTEGIVATLPNGVVSSSAQLTSSYDSRYVLSGSISAVPAGTISGSTQITALGYAITGSNTFVGTQTMSGSIIPATDNAYDLGSATYQWRDIYVSSGSLYIDGTKVLGSTGNELQITTDVGQSIKILEAGSDSIILQSADGNIELKSSGGGNLLFDPTSGLIDVRGTLQIQDGNKITSSGGNTIQFGNNIAITGSIISTTTPLISGSSQIDVMSTTNIARLATTGSNLFVGNQNITGTLYLTGSLIPSGNFAYDLGSETNSFRDLFISTGSIRFHNPDGTEQGRITVDKNSGDISLLKTAGLTNEQKATISQGNINPDFLTAVSASNLFVQNKIVMPAGGTINGINLTTFSSSVANKIGQSLNTTDNVQFNTITANQFNITTISSSVLFTSGSTKFGDTQDDIMSVTGSLKVTGSTNFTELTGSLASFSSSLDSRIGAINVGTLSASIATTDATQTTNITAASASAWGAFQSASAYSASVKLVTDTFATSASLATARATDISTISSSVKTITDSISGRVTTIEGKTLVSGSSQIDVMSTTNIARLATTGSNQFNGNQIITGSLIIGAAASTLPLNVYTSSANVNNVIAEFYNGDYTSGTKNFIRVRNNVSLGSSMSSYFGQGQDNNTYIVSNDFTRGGDIVISGNTGDATFVGNVIPKTNNSKDLGSATYGWRNIYTNDLHLSNEGKPEGNDVDGTTGNWTIQEGAEHLYIINNKTGKKFKFSLEEIQ